jgi:hypothetical protein
MNPPRHAVVVSIDEKSQIQALDRTQPGLPLKILNSQLVGISANRPGRVVLMMIPILGRFCTVAFLNTYDW